MYIYYRDHNFIIFYHNSEKLLIINLFRFKITTITLIIILFPTFISRYLSILLTIHYDYKKYPYQIYKHEVQNKKSQIFFKDFQKPPKNFYFTNKYQMRCKVKKSWCFCCLIPNIIFHIIYVY